MFKSSYNEFIYKRTYARYIYGESRREDWGESVARYEEFFLPLVPKTKQSEFQKACDAIKRMEIMPSMRSLWTAGPALERENLAAYNCSYTPIDRPRAFSEMLYILMNGTGVGFSVEKKYINKLPPVPKKFRDLKTAVVSVADSKLGWAKALGEVISYLYKGITPTFDLTKVRPRGAPLKTFGGRASGPAPLKLLFETIVKTFQNAAGRRLTSLECHDICCMIANAVVVGGARRSACISLTDLSDTKMAHAKNGQFWDTAPHRSLANNSVAYSEKPDASTFMEEWLNLMRSNSGERGIFNRQGARLSCIQTGRRDHEHVFGVNPCFHPDTYIETVDGPMPISEIIRPTKVYSMTNDGQLCISQASAAWVSKRNAKLLSIEYTNGSIKVTPDHLLYVLGKGWTKAQDIVVGDKLNPLTRHRRGCRYAGVKLGSEPRSATREERKSGLHQYCLVTGVEDGGESDVYDISVADTHCVIANSIVAHNCGEVILRPQGLCNLTEVVIRPKDTPDELCKKVRQATILGIIQCTLTNFSYVHRSWKKNAEDERLLGVSLTGLCDHPVLNKVSKESRVLLTELRQVALDTAKEWSDALDINMPAAVTCVKPSGTVSQLVDCSSGLHPRWSPYYVRRVRVNKADPIAKFLIDKKVPSHPENGDIVFEFPQKSPETSIMRDEVTAIKQLSYWLMLKKYWCEHNPSATIYVKEHEWMEVGAWVYKNWDSVCGLTFLPYDGGVYKLAPYEEIAEDEYEELAAKFPDLDFSELTKYENGDLTNGSREFACGGNSCELV